MSSRDPSRKRLSPRPEHLPRARACTHVELRRRPISRRAQRQQTTSRSRDLGRTLGSAPKRSPVAPSRPRHHRHRPGKSRTCDQRIRKAIGGSPDTVPYSPSRSSALVTTPRSPRRSAFALSTCPKSRTDFGCPAGGHHARHGAAGACHSYRRSGSVLDFRLVVKRQQHEPRPRHRSPA